MDVITALHIAVLLGSAIAVYLVCAGRTVAAKSAIRWLALRTVSTRVIDVLSPVARIALLCGWCKPSIAVVSVLRAAVTLYLVTWWPTEFMFIASIKRMLLVTEVLGETVNRRALSAIDGELLCYAAMQVAVAWHLLPALAPDGGALAVLVCAAVTCMPWLLGILANVACTVGSLGTTQDCMASMIDGMLNSFEADATARQQFDLYKRRIMSAVSFCADARVAAVFAYASGAMHRRTIVTGTVAALLLIYGRPSAGVAMLVFVYAVAHFAFAWQAYTPCESPLRKRSLPMPVAVPMLVDDHARDPTHATDSDAGLRRRASAGNHGDSDALHQRGDSATASCIKRKRVVPACHGTGAGLSLLAGLDIFTMGSTLPDAVAEGPNADEPHPVVDSSAIALE